MIRRAVIFEFAPTADEIWSVSQHDKDGYVRYDAENGLVCFLDTAHDAKPRPEIITTYAGGKSTNVARVLDRLLFDESKLRVEQITFLPPPPEGPLQKLEFGNIRTSTSAGIYVQCLQISEFRKVKPRFEVVDELRETGRMQTTRRCIEITLKNSSVSLNFSPRIVWSQRAAEAVLSKMADLARGADLVVLAGAPPVWETEHGARLTPSSFYAKIIDSLEPGCQVSIDTRGRYLYECLIAHKSPRFAFMNTEEFGELTELLHSGAYRSKCSKRTFPGTLLVHDESGCWVWDKAIAPLPDKSDTLDEVSKIPSIPVPRVYSTIGAGDAMHAGFLKEWICADSLMPPEERLRRAVIYSQVVAAAAVSNERATHGIDARVVEDRFQAVIRNA